MKLATVAALILVASPVLAGPLDCAEYERCTATLAGDAHTEARHRCQSGSHDAMLRCRDETAATYETHNKSRCEALLAACGRSETHVTIESP